MPDILDRLEDFDDETVGLGGCWPGDRPCRALIRDAADEIKRLRAALEAETMPRAKVEP